MSDPANQLNVPTDAPIEQYRTPNVSPSFETENKDTTFGQTGTPVNSPGSIDVSTGATGAPVSSGG